MTPRRALSSIILVIALIAGSIAYTSFIARRVTNEPDTVADAASSVIDQPVIRDQMVDEIAAAILAYVGPGFAEAAGIPGLDAAAEARAIARDTVLTPEYEAAVYQTLLDLHEMSFVGPQGKLFIDSAGVTRAARSVAIARNPVYAQMIPTDAALVVTSPISDVPDLTALKANVNGAFAWTLAITLLGLTAAFALHDKRYRVLRRVGFWAAMLAAGHLLIGWVLPSIADVYIDERDDPPIAETLTRTIGSFVRDPAIFLFVTGVVLVIASFLWPMIARSSRFAMRSDQQPAEPTPARISQPPASYPASPPTSYPTALPPPQSVPSPPPTTAIPVTAPPPPTAAMPVATQPPPTAAMPVAQDPSTDVAGSAPTEQRGQRPGDEAFAPPDDKPPIGDSVFDD